MRKIVVIILISFIVGFTAFTDAVDKVTEEKWFLAIIALKVTIICTLIFFGYLNKLKTCKEDDLPIPNKKK